MTSLLPPDIAALDPRLSRALEQDREIRLAAMPPIGDKDTNMTAEFVRLRKRNASLPQLRRMVRLCGRPFNGWRVLRSRSEAPAGMDRKRENRPKTAPVRVRALANKTQYETLPAASGGLRLGKR